ncbi:ribonuclease P protein component [Acidipila rosea]|nr:ribonuclease P protein component [Acidipila rosea]
MPTQTQSSTTVTEQPPRRGVSLAPFRLHRHGDYQSAYKAARKQSSPSMSYFYRVRPAELIDTATPRIGLTVGRVLGNAVKRNRIKRRMREAVRLHLDLLPQSIDVILHPRHFVAEMEFSRLEAEIVTIFHRIASAVHAVSEAQP